MDDKNMFYTLKHESLIDLDWATDLVDYHELQPLYNTICYVTWPLRSMTIYCREQIAARR